MSRKCELTGKSPLKGHKVSHANNKVKRKFFPNLKKVTFKSDILKKNVKLRVSNAALRSVDYKGGIDFYLKSVKNKIGAGKKIKENVGMIGIPTEGKPTFGSPKVEHNSFKPSFGESFSKDKKKKKPIDELLELEIKKS